MGHKNKTNKHSNISENRMHTGFHGIGGGGVLYNKSNLMEENHNIDELLL